jgi:tetratricopeptide (TPR) repeat protein
MNRLVACRLADTGLAFTALVIVASSAGQLCAQQPASTPASAPAVKPAKKEPENWVGQTVIPRPGVTLKAARGIAPPAWKDVPKLPWKITQVNGDWLWMGKTWIKKQDVQVVDIERDAALIGASEQIRTELGNATHYLMRAEYCRAADDNENAILDLNFALRLEPRFPEALGARGARWMAMGKLEQALADANAAVKLAPEFISFRAQVYERMGKRAEAAADWNAALKQDPNNYVVRAGFYGSQGRHEEALADFAKAIELNPNHRVSRAFYFEEQGKWAEALEDYDAVVRAGPVLVSPIVSRRAWLLATCPDDKIRNGERALADAKAAYGEQKSFESAEALAAAYAETGDFERAVKAQEEAIKFYREEAVLEPKIEARLALYRDKKPYRTPQKTN